MAPYVTAPPPGIEILQRYEDCPPVRIDAKVLGRALVNLVENALQSMPDGGTLEVLAEPADDRTIVAITVRDTGTGLSPEVRDRLFEPYFSTKSSGTGLGLAIVRRSVEAHGGRIEVESRQGSGTAFRMRIPAVRVGSSATDRDADRSRG
jgi:signal transduction histidine kinase